MTPKKVRNILPEIAVSSKEDLALLQKLTVFFWEKVREALTAKVYFKFQIPSLGEFEIKHWKLEFEIKKLQETKQRLQGKASVAALAEIDFKIDHISGLLKAYQEEEKRRLMCKCKKDEYYKTLEK